jgi:hypothetical protein
VRDVALLSVTPWRLWNRVRVRAGLDDGKHTRPELVLDRCLQRADSAGIVVTLVLDRIVKQRCNRFVTAAAMLDDQRGNSQEMRDIR